MADLWLPPSATLLYGMGGAGKTPLAISSFWDWEKQELLGEGKYITFGAEDNPELNIPDEARKLGKGLNLRLTSPLLEDQEFIEQFDLITRKLLYDAERGERIDALVVDGLAEFDLLYEMTFESPETDSGKTDKFAKWDALLAQTFSLMMRLVPSALGCQVIMTTRVQERRKSSGNIKGDPKFWEYDYYPAMRGGFKYMLPHYFNQVFYLETVSAEKGGRTIPAHAVHLLQTGDFMVKNQAEHRLLASGQESPVLNIKWPELWKIQHNTEGN